MIKRLNLFILLCTLTSTVVYAQWTKTDSLNLQQLLKEQGEIEINKNVIKQIDFGNFLDKPKEIDNDPGLEWDNKLPDAKTEDIYKHVTLRPYSSKTPFNYDPVRMIKFKVGPRTWIDGPYTDPKSQIAPIYWSEMHYTNYAKSMFDKPGRKSLEEIEGTGLRYNPIGERANSSGIGTWEFTPGTTNIGRSRFYTSMNGGGIGSLDFNAITTREFWDKSIGKRRARTLEVLKHYGDSTTIHINTPIKPK